MEVGICANGMMLLCDYVARITAQHFSSKWHHRYRVIIDKWKNTTTTTKTHTNKIKQKVEISTGSAIISTPYDKSFEH